MVHHHSRENSLNQSETTLSSSILKGKEQILIRVQCIVTLVKLYKTLLYSLLTNDNFIKIPEIKENQDLANTIKRINDNPYEKGTMSQRELFEINVDNNYR